MLPKNQKNPFLRFRHFQMCVLDTSTPARTFLRHPHALPSHVRSCEEDKFFEHSLAQFGDLEGDDIWGQVSLPRFQCLCFPKQKSSAISCDGPLTLLPPSLARISLRSLNPYVSIVTLAP